MVPGLWKTHTLSWLSTATPPTWPLTHLFGRACDHNGSGSNVGTCLAPDCAPAILPVDTRPKTAAIASPAPSTTALRFISAPCLLPLMPMPDLRPHTVLF